MSQLPCSFLLIRVECLSSRAQAHAQDQGNLPGNGLVPGNQHDDDHHHHPMQIPSNVSAPVLISVDSCRMSQLPCSFPMPMQIPSNVSAPVLMSVDLCRMFQLACSFLMPMQIPSNVSARVLIFVDLCGMSQLACSCPHFRPPASSRRKNM